MSDYSKYTTRDITVACKGFDITSDGHAATQNSAYATLNSSISYDSKSGVYTVSMTAKCGNRDGNNSYSTKVTWVSYLTPHQ